MLGKVKRAGLDIRAEGGYVIWWPLHFGQQGPMEDIQPLPAGLIDERTHDEIAREHPRGGPRLGGVWRALVFVFVSCGAIACTAGSAGSIVTDGFAGLSVLLAACGLVLLAATELLLRRFSYAATGAETATSFLCVLFLVVSVALWATVNRLGEPLELQAGLATAALVLAAAAWRWGFPLYAAAATACLFFLAGYLPAARLLWILLAGAAVWGGARLRRPDFMISSGQILCDPRSANGIRPPSNSCRMFPSIISIYPIPCFRQIVTTGRSWATTINISSSSCAGW